ncbi:hypothetical protein DDJ49_30460, partial [Klebsiella pneumoniae]
MQPRKKACTSAPEHHYSEEADEFNLRVAESFSAQECDEHAILVAQMQPHTIAPTQQMQLQQHLRQLQQQLQSPPPYPPQIQLQLPHAAQAPAQTPPRRAQRPQGPQATRAQTGKARAPTTKPQSAKVRAQAAKEEEARAETRATRVRV